MNIENVTSDGVLVFHQCLICEEQFLEYSELEEHRKSHVKVEISSQDDPYQTQKKLSYVEVEEEKAAKEDEKDADDVDEDEADDDDDAEEEDADDDAEEEDEVHQCRLCGQEFKQYEQLEEHCEDHLRNENTSNNKKVWHTCDICQEILPSPEQLEIHKLSHKADVITTKLPENKKLRNIYKCDICGKRCKRPFDLTIHVRTHTGEKPIQREIRSKPPLVDLHALAQANVVITGNPVDHMSFIPGPLPYKCNICNRKFRQQINLNKHFKLHTGEKKFSCSLCSQILPSAQRLQTHIRSHQELKKFRCNICGKSFYGNSQLRNHSRIHTGEKPYQCHLCQRAFNQAGNLRTHMKVHVSRKLKKPRIRPIQPRCETSSDSKGE